jgi:N4-(beta-N-acetylglucosaminyl)-L-asparaginase
MANRRTFIKNSAILAGAAAIYPVETLSQNFEVAKSKGHKPIILSTWNFGLISNKAAWEILKKGGRSLDAVEEGARVAEADYSNLSVGLGALPDRDGHVTLDACIMDEDGGCGSVCFMENIKHPISVARMVMEKTPHVMLAGEGAQKFALENGFSKEPFDRSEAADKAWKEWLKKSKYKPEVNLENHDTIGLISLDKSGNLAGACTTSGMAYKMRGRIGDSPIIGAGLFVDNEIGACTATGHGEEVIRIAGSHLVVELMRQGNSPEKACKKAIERVYAKNKHRWKDIQIGFIAINKKGEYGAYALQGGFNYAVCTGDNEQMLVDSKFLMK